MASWYRFYDETLDDLKLHCIAEDLDVPFLVVFGAWAGILTLASKSPVRGHLMLTESRALTIRNVAETLHCNETETKRLLHAFADAGMMHFSDMRCLAVSKWSKRQYDSDLSTERVRKHRELQRSRNVSETDQIQSTETDTDTETEGKGIQAAPAPLPPSDPALAVLRGIKTYPYDYRTDSKLIADLRSEYPDVDVTKVATDYAVWVSDHPIRKGKDSPRLKLRTFVRKVHEWAQERKNGGKPAVAGTGRRTF